MQAITYTRTALKQLRSIGAAEAKRVVAKVEQYAADPASLADQAKALKGVDAYRLGAGDYRVIFSEDATVLLVLKIGHRKEVYE